MHGCMHVALGMKEAVMRCVCKTGRDWQPAVPKSWRLHDLLASTCTAWPNLCIMCLLPWQPCNLSHLWHLRSPCPVVQQTRGR